MRDYSVPQAQVPAGERVGASGAPVTVFARTRTAAQMSDANMVTTQGETGPVTHATVASNKKSARVYRAGRP